MVALGFPAGAAPEDARPRRAASCRRRARRSASRRRTCPPTATRSRPTPRSTPASPAGRWPTATGAWSASTPRRARWAPTAARSRARTSRSASTARGRCWTGSARGASEAWTGATFGYPTTEELVDRKLPPGLYVTGAVPGEPGRGGGRGRARRGAGGHRRPPRGHDAPVLLRRDGGEAERRDGDVHARRGRAGSGARWKWSSREPGPPRRRPRPAGVPGGWDRRRPCAARREAAHRVAARRRRRGGAGGGRGGQAGLPAAAARRRRLG